MVAHLVSIQPPSEERSIRVYGGVGGGVQHHAHDPAAKAGRRASRLLRGRGERAKRVASGRTATVSRLQPSHKHVARAPLTHACTRAHTHAMCTLTHTCTRAHAPVPNRVLPVPAAVLDHKQAAVVGARELGLRRPAVKGETQWRDVGPQRLHCSLHLGGRACGVHQGGGRCAPQLVTHRAPECTVHAGGAQSQLCTHRCRAPSH